MATQKQFTKAVSQDLQKSFDNGLGSSPKEVEAILDTISNQLFKSLKKGETVTVRSIGRFKVVKRKARMGRNPQTGEALKIKASKKLKVTPEKGLRDRLGSK